MHLCTSDVFVPAMKQEAEPTPVNQFKVDIESLEGYIKTGVWFEIGFHSLTVVTL